MADQSSLSDILSDEAPAAPAAPATPAEAPPAEAKAEEPRSDGSRRKEWREKELNLQAEGMGMARDPVTGQFVKKTEAPAAEPEKKEPPPAAPAAAPQQPPAQPEMTEKERAFLRAAQEERQKRQALEAEIARLRQPQAQPEQPKAFWDDPEGALRRHQEEVRTETTNVRLNTAEIIARSRHPDFDEKVAEFAQLVQSTPGLAQQWLAAQDPAEFAYVTGKNHLMLKNVGSLDALTERVRQETEAKVRAQVEAEYKAKAEAAAKERAALPPSLTDTRGAAGAGAKPTYNGPTPLADILK
jgi:hypothetical protein